MPPIARHEHLGGVWRCRGDHIQVMVVNYMRSLCSPKFNSLLRHAQDNQKKNPKQFWLWSLPRGSKHPVSDCGGKVSSSGSVASLGAIFDGGLVIR